jgi:hypothetical protein
MHMRRGEERQDIPCSDGLVLFVVCFAVLRVELPGFLMQAKETLYH